MADNVIADAGAGGATFATDDIGGIHYPISKITVGALESQTLLSGGDGTTDEGTVRVTVSSNSTGLLSVDDNGGSLTVDTGAAFSIQEDGAALTALQLIDDIAHAGSDVVLASHVPISGQFDDTATTAVTENQVAPVRITSARALHVAQQGTVTVDGSAVTQPVSGTVTANAGTGTMSVDWVGVAPPIGAGTEATALRVTLATDSTGLISIDDNGGSLTVDSADLLTIAGAVSGTEMQVDIVTGTVTVTHPQLGGGTEAGSQRVTIANDSTGLLSIDDNGGSITVDNGGTFVVQEDGAALTALQLIDNAVAGAGFNITQLNGVNVSMGNGLSGTGVQRVTIASDTTGVLSVDDNGASLTVDSADLVTIAGAVSGTEMQVDVLTLPASTNTLEVVGDAAHDVAIAGNPVRIAARAETTDITAVADGDTCDLISSTLGKQVQLPYATPSQTWHYAAVSGGITDTADDVAKAAAGAGIRNYITSVQVINGHATVNTEVVVKDGSTIVWRGFAQNSGGGVSAKFDPPLRGTANAAVNVTNITTGAATYFNLQGFVAAE